MKARTLVPRLTMLLATSAALVVAFLVVVRPWYASWGASEDEQRATLPGDEIIGAAATQETRAITIHAPIARVWPWLAQIGQDRGGFYSYDLLENLVGSRMPTADHLRPDAQGWSLGDRLWMYPPERVGGIGFATLRAYLPGRVLAFGTHPPGVSPDVPEEGSWSFLLNEVNDSTTRLIIRGRARASGSPFVAAFNRLVFEPMHFVMERRMMIGIKQLAEGGSRGRLANHAQVGLWVIAFGLMVAAAVRMVRREPRGRTMAGLVVAAVIFQVLTLGQPALLAGLVLVVLADLMVWWPAAAPPGLHLQGDHAQT